MSYDDRFISPQKKDYSGSNQSKQAPIQRSLHQDNIIQREKMYPQSMTPADVMALQGTIGNQAVYQLMSEIGLDNGNTELVHTKSENKTGLPDSLKAGVENLSGLSMDDVRVHYNSDKPAQVGALAYTQGTDIHVAPGQERHLPHEAWHVVQQAQGRVQPTMQLKGVTVNDDLELEREASEMGGKSLQHIATLHPMASMRKSVTRNSTMQFKKNTMKIENKEYTVGTKWMDDPELNIRTHIEYRQIKINEEIIRSICNKWAEQELEFTSQKDFITELCSLLFDWSNQCYLYKQNPDGSDLRPGTKAPSDKNIKFYTSRPTAHIIDLYLWAIENGIGSCLEGFPEDMPEKRVSNDPVDMFHGHLGDRTIAMKYLKSKGKNIGTIMIEFTQEGSRELINHFINGRHDTDGDRMPKEDQIVTKCDSKLFSLALNHNGLDYFKDKISRIRLIVAPPNLLQDVSLTAPSASSSTV